MSYRALLIDARWFCVGGASDDCLGAPPQAAMTRLSWSTERQGFLCLWLSRDNGRAGSQEVHMWFYV